MSQQLPSQPPPNNQQPPAQPQSSDDGKPNSGLVAIIIHHSITVLILIMVIGLVVWGYLNFQDSDFFATVDRAEFDAQLHPPLQQAQSQRLNSALEVYSLVYREYPPQLDDLVRTGLLVPSDLYYPRGPDSWTYQRHGDSFTLEPSSIADSDSGD